jgi:aminomethyltransferase
MATSPILEAQRHAVPVLTAGPAREDSVQTALWFGDRKGRRTAIAAEYDAVTSGAGLFDRSWLSKLRITGSDRLTFLNGMITQDVAKLKPGESRHAAMLDPSGHFVADIFVHALADSVLVESDARAAVKLYQTLDRYLIMEDAAIEDISASWGILAVQGEQARERLARSLAVPSLKALTRDNNIAIAFDGVSGFAAFREHSRYGGADIWLPAEAAGALWTRLASEIAPAGELAAEILRVEGGIPRWGAELDSSVLLPEAGFEDAVSYSKGCYIGQEIIARIHARGHANRNLRAFLFDASAPVDPGNRIYPADGLAEREVGRLTSVVESPLTGGVIGLGYIRREYVDDGIEILALATNGAPAPGTVRDFPL